ncbi:hypothetical protein FQR65_LT09382 [Abscondita terminalis]|nr:hypothetical protein FQR65_LT09382 [Abscondita terminalis]
MDGFYYDAEIEHITEVIKNVLYFAVLEGEDNKILKNTHEVFYFSIDNELLYLNYYFDFGPLSISCLYKYCCKLNNYLHYVRSSKRVVHYTTSNSMRRVNAAFLMGCYSIIHLKMTPNEIYKILLTAGGSFIHFIDASQGISQYTINILDCFHAIHKALNFNFFNFCDFNVLEYDTYDKLLNGDMNWLLPRKFLAFIGPTDNIIMNGHPPDHYVQYFLENDIKTVIRLNNKVYDSSVFTKAGIEHHELFFPDGTIPTKQILLRFLNLSESARAAVAVHCKAGLGRTGSLIGAYIIKHYRMSAREAIAWMRICRPGSVIGQQQGWLEKIETWLWKQGNNFRLQHFGEGDKMPRHKYGIYSKAWSIERERLIRHVQKRRTETQHFSLRDRLEMEKRCTSSDLPQRCNYCNVAQTKSSKTRNRSKILTNFPKYDDIKPKPKLHLFHNKHGDLNNMEIKNNFSYAQEILNRAVKPKRLPSVSKFKEKFTYETNVIANTEDSHRSIRHQQDSKMFQIKLRKRNQSECRDQYGEKKYSSRIQKEFVPNLEQTQGDKLNEIKAKRLSDCFYAKERIYEPGTSRKKCETITKCSYIPNLFSAKS